MTARNAMPHPSTRRTRVESHSTTHGTGQHTAFLNIEKYTMTHAHDDAVQLASTKPEHGGSADTKKRSFGDQALATAMANLLWRFERRTSDMRGKRATADEVQAILQEFPRLIGLRSYARKMVEFGRSSVMGYGAFVIERDDPQLAPDFLQALLTGANLPPGHPILALRSTLQRLRRENASQAEQLNALLAGWRRYKTY
jgi:hypothetical protein